MKRPRIYITIPVSQTTTVLILRVESDTSGNGKETEVAIEIITAIEIRTAEGMTPVTTFQTIHLSKTTVVDRVTAETKTATVEVLDANDQTLSPWIGIKIVTETGTGTRIDTINPDDRIRRVKGANVTIEETAMEVQEAMIRSICPNDLMKEGDPKRVTEPRIRIFWLKVWIRFSVGYLEKGRNDFDCCGRISSRIFGVY